MKSKKLHHPLKNIIIRSRRLFPRVSLGFRLIFKILHEFSEHIIRLILKDEQPWVVVQGRNPESFDILMSQHL